jgi:glycosyltransferase involved in cell wall biosynthesis
MNKVSVIVPAFKRVDQTLRTLDLLLSSHGVGSSFELEIILADSSPDTALQDAVASKFCEKIIYIKPDKPGIAANKNAGAKAAHHPILIFCDSDMEVEDNALLEITGALQIHTKAAMVGATVLWRTGPNDGQKDRPRIEDRMFIKDDTKFTESIYSRFFATYKDIFWSVGGYDEDVFNMRGEGSDLSIRYWRAGLPLAYEESVIVHHVFDVPDAAAVRVEHAEWGVAKDLLLLGYKYDMFNDGFKNFPATVDIDFSPLGAEGYYRMLQGIGKNFDMIVSSKPFLDAFRAKDHPAYDFKFLEVFSNAGMLDSCIGEAELRLKEVRESAFGT